MIDFQNINVKFGNDLILENLNLNIRENRVAIIGSNGSGKSTLARLINGLVMPTSGEMIVYGDNTKQNVKKIRKKIGFVFQNPDNQIVLPTVADDLAFGLKNLKFSKIEIKQKVDEVLKTYGLDELRDKSTYHLSGGQKQLLAIAGVMAMNPAHIIFDEPTTLLDMRNKIFIKKVIENITSPAIVITHDLDLIKNFDRVIVLEKGKIMADDTPASAINHYMELLDL